MKSCIAAVMLLAFAMGLGYHEWDRTWNKPNKSEASQKEIRAVVWADDSV